MPKKDYDTIHRTNMDVYARKIQAIYNSAIKEAASIGVTIHDFNPDKLFSFADYPITATRVEKLVKSLQNNIETVILNGTEHEWTLSNNKNNELARRVFGDSIGKLSKIQEQRYFSNNLDALATFQKRKVAGLGLSDRVWKYTYQFKDEIELGIDVGLRSGLPSAEMGRSLRDYLQNPDKLFRRVRDEHGVLKLSKAAKAYSPGRGVYRSSGRNAERLARTETNMSYRTSDYERWHQFDFVVGIEIRRSNNRSCTCPLCDSLSGRYPKDFKFTGWHPQCRCHAVPVLKSIEELRGDTDRIITGQPTDGQSVNTVNQMPDNFTDWIESNKERFGANNTPYFVKDNLQYVSSFNKEEVQSALQTTTSASLLAYLSATEAFTKQQPYWNFAKSKGMAPAEALAIYEYTNTNYGAINEKLRHNLILSNDEKQYIQTLNSGLEKLDKYRGTLYRGSELSPYDIKRYQKAAKDGTTIREQYFMSASVDQGVAVNFMDNVMFEIQSKTGRIINNISCFGTDEKEIIFQLNTQFTVENVDKIKFGKGKITKIQLREK